MTVTELSVSSPLLWRANYVWYEMDLLFICCLVSLFVAIIQLISRIWLFVTPWTEAHQAPLSSAISQSLLKLMSIESVMPSNHLILCCPLYLLSLIFPSIRVFSNELALLIRWPKYRSFSISTSNEYSGLISFSIDWFDPLVYLFIAVLELHSCIFCNFISTFSKEIAFKSYFLGNSWTFRCEF